MSRYVYEPLAYVCVSNHACQSRIVAALRRQGWRIRECPTGFHVVQELADAIVGREADDRPHLVVVDAIARGCTGTSIAEGLRDLGAHIPVVLVTSECARASDGEIITVDPVLAPYVIGELARPRAQQVSDHALA